MPDIIAVSTSSGDVYVMSISETQRSTVVSKTAALTHDLETWTVAFSPPTWTTGPQMPPSNDGEANNDETTMLA
ncbi:hypothetical protein Sste5344_009856 [Sporothrix stenoceras]